jgi:hypothetical protein
VTSEPDEKIPAWARDPDVLERVFRAAVAAGDVRGVEAALTLMACVDPDRAQRLMADLELGLHLASILDEIPGGSQPQRRP